MIEYLLSGDNYPTEGKIVFDSSDHIRYQNGKAVSGHNYGANRRVVIENNVDGGPGYTVTLYNMDGVNPLWKNNIQMAPKPMRIVDVEGNVVELRGYGYDAMGGDFSDYGILLLIEDHAIKRVQLNLYDRGVSILYLKTEIMDSSQSLTQVRIDSFSFEPSRFEEWKGGKRIDYGSTTIKIECTAYDDGSAEVKLLNNDLKSKVSDCSFDMAINLDDRVLLCSYPSHTNANIIAMGIVEALFTPSRGEKFYEQNEPVLSSLFFNQGRLVKVTFTTCNPERLIEFYQ